MGKIQEVQLKPRQCPLQTVATLRCRGGPPAATCGCWKTSDTRPLGVLNFRTEAGFSTEPFLEPRRRQSHCLEHWSAVVLSRRFARKCRLRVSIQGIRNWDDGDI